MGIRGEVFSSKAHTGKRVYFFNVKENRNGDLFLNMVESKKHAEDGTSFERHSMIVFEEDMDTFLASLQDAVDYIRQVQGRAKEGVSSLTRNYSSNEERDEIRTRKLTDELEMPARDEWAESEEDRQDWASNGRNHWADSDRRDWRDDRGHYSQDRDYDDRRDNQRFENDERAYDDRRSGKHDPTESDQNQERPESESAQEAGNEDESKN